jgi:flagellar hook-length control protein FliK
MMALPAIIPTANPAAALPELNFAPFAAFLNAADQQLSEPDIQHQTPGPATPQEPSTECKGVDIARNANPEPNLLPAPMPISAVGCPDVAALPFVVTTVDQPSTDEGSDETGDMVQTESAEPVSPGVTKSLPVNAPAPMPSPLPADQQNAALTDVPFATTTRAAPKFNMRPVASSLPATDVTESARPVTHLTSANEQSQPTMPVFQLPAQVELPTSSPLAKVAILPQLDLTQDTGWVEGLARDIAMSAATEGKVSFRLIPEFLGELDISLSRNADNVDLQIQTQSDIANRIISAEQPRLIEDLRLSGLKIGEFAMATGQREGAPRQQMPHQPQHQPITEQPEKRPTPQRSDRFA